MTLGGLVVALLVLGLLGEAERSPSPTDSLPEGYDSTAATALLGELPEDDESVALILFTADEGELGDRIGELEQLVSPLQPAEDGTAALGIQTVPSATATQTSQEVGDLRTELREAVPEGVTVQVTGPAGIEADLAGVFEGANTTLLIATASVVALLLLVTYRSPVLWIIPLAVVGLADRMAAVLATRVLAAFDIPWDESTIGILSVLVFGAGTNYALLLVSRYRDELREHDDRGAAMALALRRAAEAVFASAATVFVGLLTLLLSVIPTTRGLGLACAVGILTAAVFVLVVLPAVLVLFGRWVFWPRVPQVGQQALADSRSVWRRVGDRVATRPPAYIVGSLLFLAVLATGLFRIDLGLSTDEQFLETPEAITAATRIAQSFPAGTAEPTTVVTRAGDDEAAALEEELTALEGVGSARVSLQQAGITRLDVVLDAEPGSAQAQESVRDLRAAVADLPDTHVGGAEAEALDEAEGTARDRTLIIPLILGLVLVALAGILRSVLAPVILVASVVCTFAASLGISWWLFTGVLDFSALDSGVPLLAFLFLVALGVDYNIFLITRTLEEARGHGTRSGVLRALGATGGVITSAGILLAAVFAVLGVLPLVVLAQLGVVICIGVLLDTLLVRTVLVPAIVLTLGERFWWPRVVAGPVGTAPGRHRR
ncbi:RND superfamily putative drug exporter [Ornithinicoccus hortensis]|uniref:RND superfamily putative drug exporter n=1 Tax=Ornithinicoccus hortensis TaxID=82346 RepID=A0A542YNB2_9MICO|nr:RND superfamily putative drug exporter [Ornithinicoccus hortensis]